MSVRIQLDQHDVPHYTNLDFISGRVILNLTNDTTVSQINVKLEGESRTRLAGPRSHNDRPDKVKTELELHKFLYNVQTVFPDQSLRVGPNPQFTVGAGQYEYPFQFKFPFNTDCKNTPTTIQDLKFGGINVQFAPPPVRHVKQALPPTLGGFPGEAEIKYFVKVTVVRPKFYLENLRAQYAIRFMPIEPPRPANRMEEQFARRQHQFQPGLRDASLKKKLFRKSSSSGSGTGPLNETEPLSIKVDARLPSPPILTCQRPLPLRVLVERLNDSAANIYLSTFQIELVAFTSVRAHDLKRDEISTWILFSRANMDMILGNADDKSTNQYLIPPRLWENIPLPNTVIPTFQTCNLSRRYELEVRIGITHGTSDGPRPELATLPLRLPCEVFSGIAPPQELLTRMQSQRVGGAGLAPPSIQTGKADEAGGYPHTPVTPVQESSVPAQVGTLHQQNFAQDDNDLPPSYEDAMAEDIGPVDGPRQHFEFSMAAQQQPLVTPGDSKSSSGLSGGLNRHPSERLFSQNAPKPPGASMSSNLSSHQSNTVFEEPDDFDNIAPPLHAPPPPPLPISDTFNNQPDIQRGQDDIAHDLSDMHIQSPTRHVDETETEPPPPPLPVRKPTVKSLSEKS